MLFNSLYVKKIWVIWYFCLHTSIWCGWTNVFEVIDRVIRPSCDKSIIWELGEKILKGFFILLENGDYIPSWFFEYFENQQVCRHILRLITGRYLSLILKTTQHWKEPYAVTNIVITRDLDHAFTESTHNLNFGIYLRVSP